MENGEVASSVEIPELSRDLGDVTISVREPAPGRFEAELPPHLGRPCRPRRIHEDDGAGTPGEDRSRRCSTAPRPTGARATRPDRRSQLMLELDLVGRKVALTDSEASALLAAAEFASGSSIGSRDLATRLKDVNAPPSSQARRRRLVFSRPESRALQRVIESRVEPDERFRELELTLAELLGHDPAHTS